MRCLRNVADLFVEQLTAWGVRFVYGIPGGSILPVLDAVRRSEDIRFIVVRHESTAAFMASAYGKLTGRLGVCAAITGAGATNLVTGLADAAWDRSPVLSITGQVPQELVGSGVFQEIDQYGLFASLAVYNQVLQSPAQIREVLSEAMRTAIVRRGVSHIGIPVDLQSETYCGDIITPDSLLPSSGYPHPAALERALEAVGNAKRPVILAGRGAWPACQEVALLSERLCAPVATTPPAKGLFDEHGPRALGVLGRLGLHCSIDVFEQADLAILIGADVVEQRLVPKVPTIQIVPDPLEIADDLAISASLAGDIRLIISALVEQIPQRGDEEWVTHAASIHADCVNRMDGEVSQPGKYVHPKAVIAGLAEMVNEDAVVAVDIGDVTYWYMQYFPATRQRTLISAHLASMGFAFPAALAAQLEYPERQVICITGDGGFGMSMADFTTAVKYDLPVIVVLYNNNAYQRVTGEQREAGLPEFAIDLLNPNFAAFAQSCGGLGIRVERQEDVRDALNVALKSGMPAIVEVLTDRAVHAVPTLPGARWTQE